MAARNADLGVQKQNFWTEVYEKERDTRLRWYFNLKDTEPKRPKQLEVFRRKLKEGSKPSAALLERLPTIAGERRYNTKKIDPVDTLLERSNTLDLGSVMRPVTPRTKRKLYDGFTKEGKGRHQYLERRYKKNPESKFEFPLCSSWDYGWRLSDVIKKDEIKKPAHGRTRIVSDEFYNRNGI